LIYNVFFRHAENLPTIVPICGLTLGGS
jgi:hypothetical protein